MRAISAFLLPSIAVPPRTTGEDASDCAPKLVDDRPEAKLPVLDGLNPAWPGQMKGYTPALQPYLQGVADQHGAVAPFKD